MSDVTRKVGWVQENDTAAFSELKTVHKTYNEFQTESAVSQWQSITPVTVS